MDKIPTDKSTTGRSRAQINSSKQMTASSIAAGTADANSDTIAKDETSARGGELNNSTKPAHELDEIPTKLDEQSQQQDQQEQPPPLLITQVHEEVFSAAAGPVSKSLDVKQPSADATSDTITITKDETSGGGLTSSTTTVHELDKQPQKQEEQLLSGTASVAAASAEENYKERKNILHEYYEQNCEDNNSKRIFGCSKIRNNAVRQQ